jgi:hypothetical protein
MRSGIYDSFKELESNLSETNLQITEIDAKDELFYILKNNQNLGEEYFRISKHTNLYSEKLIILKSLINNKSNTSLYYNNIDEYYKKIRSL